MHQFSINSALVSPKKTLIHLWCKCYRKAWKAGSGDERRRVLECCGLLEKQQEKSTHSKAAWDLHWSHAELSAQQSFYTCLSLSHTPHYRWHTDCRQLWVCVCVSEGERRISRDLSARTTCFLTTMWHHPPHTHWCFPPPSFPLFSLHLSSLPLLTFLIRDNGRM